MLLGAGMHLVSVAGGALAMLIALLAPGRFAPFSGFAYGLMGPAHWTYGVRAGRHKRALTATLAATGTAAPAA